MALAAVVFDLDYTLAVPERDRQTLLNEATAAAGVEDIDRSEYLAVHGEDRATETRRPIFEALVDDADGVTAAYREAVNNALRPVADVPELLSELRTQYQVGLLTDGPVRAQRTKLEALGWENLFDAVVITGSLRAGKPDQRAFDAICSELGVSPAATAYVGDHPEADVRGASDAGMAAVQVSTERFERAPEADYCVDCDRLAPELRAVLERIHSGP